MPLETQLKSVKLKTGKSPALLKKLAEKNGFLIKGRLKPETNMRELLGWLKKGLNLSPEQAKAVCTFFANNTQASEAGETKGILKICSEGHRYHKRSDCRTCPVCENKRKPAEGLLTKLSAPARRALQSIEVHTAQDLSKFSEDQVLQLHGLGPSSIPKLKAALKAEGLSFKKSR